MWVHRRPSWRLKESEATSESAYLNRRELVAAIAAGSILATTGGAQIGRAHV